MSAKQTSESFWRRVNVGAPEVCWEWQGSVNNTGYGTVGWHGKNYTAHRIAAWLTGLVTQPAAPNSKRNPTHVLHHCDNRRCCNPAHFFLGTYADNQKDAYVKRRREQPKGEAHSNAKVTNEDAEIIRVLYSTGLSQIELARQYEISQSAISKIILRRTYICS